MDASEDVRTMPEMRRIHTSMFCEALIFLCCALVATPHWQFYTQPLEKGCNRVRCVTRSA
jgi:hypothetical protein